MTFRDFINNCDGKKYMGDVVDVFISQHLPFSCYCGRLKDMTLDDYMFFCNMEVVSIKPIKFEKPRRNASTGEYVELLEIILSEDDDENV